MPALARTPLAIFAGLALVVGASAALHIAGTTQAVPTPPPPSSLPPAVNPLYPKIGMNLVRLTNYSNEVPLLNRFKLVASGNWYVIENYTNITATEGYFDASKLNSDNYPIAMPGRGIWGANAGLDPVDANTPKTYVLRWKGTATVGMNLVSNTVVGDHQITFTNIYASAEVQISSMDPSDPIHDISIVRSDQVAAYDAGQIFADDFVNRVVKPFGSIRTMDWDVINNSDEANWSDREKPSDAFWNRMPIEMEVALANQAGVDLWKTIPAKATDDYVRQLLTYIKANLSPSLKLHLEYSNEVWNGSFAQSQWASDQAQALWQGGGPSTYYGCRSAQIAAIAWSIFGTGSTQLRPVLAGWYAWTGPEVTDAMTKGVGLANLGAIKLLFREYAIAPYFGDALGAFPGNEADRAIVLGWAQDPTPNGLNQVFQQLEHGGLLASTGTSLDDAKYTYEPKHAAWAKANGLSLVAYEGGLSYYYYMADPTTKPVLQAFFDRMIADPRMGLLYTRWAQDFSANGGALIENFDDIGGAGEDGPWGALTTIYSPDTPRYLALRAAAAF